MSTVEISNHTRRTVPRFAYQQAAHAVLPGWDISLAFVGPTRAQALNQSLRGKSYIPNILSYAAGAKSGEIIICPAVAQKQARDYGLSPDDFTSLLFIHALLHLKGLPHGATMEKRERQLLAKFAGVSAKSL